MATDTGNESTRFDQAKLFLLSFVALYFELLVVRWTNAYVKNVGFFTNFLVLASFVGLGAGYLLKARRAPVLPFFPLLLLVYCGLVQVARPRLSVSDPGALFWGEYIVNPRDEHISLSPEAFVAIAYVMVALLFTLLGHAMGQILRRLPPLRGYGTNIAGSLLGIALFTANSFVLAKPVVWFGIVLVALVPLYLPRKDAAIVAGVFSIGVLGLVYWLDIGSQWSPYYRTEVRCFDNGECSLAGNGIWGMRLVHFAKRPNIYSTIYGEGSAVHPRRFDNVLVVGAGGGNDVNYALHYGASHVDAVEINPLALELGTKLHPDHPYASPKVTKILDDGRAFLRREGPPYDLVVYALPDSTGVVSSHANMRVESYLFTVEAFRAVRARLAPNGVFVLYTHYRAHWLVHKIAGMLAEAFGDPPLIYADESASAVLIAGPGARALANDPPFPLTDPPAPATDDWPFLYLNKPHIPALYLRSLGVIALLSITLIALFARFGRESNEHAFRLDLPMFFMGAAFMLLEAKSIVTFGLLFGTTWLTTALVIGAILVMVLAAIFVIQRFGGGALWGWGIALGAALVVVYVVPPEKFVFESPMLRYVVGALAALSPVMFANVVFAKLLGQAKETTHSLASNLVGSVFGGIAEYLSLATGYRALLPVVGIFYALAFVLAWRAARSAAPASG